MESGKCWKYNFQTGISTKMNLFTNPENRNLLIEIVKHVDPNVINQFVRLNVYINKLTKSDFILRSIVGEKKTDKFINVYETLFSEANYVKQVHFWNNGYIESKVLGRPFSCVKVPAPTPTPSGTLRNSIMVESISQTRDIEILLNLKQRCKSTGAVIIDAMKAPYGPSNCVLSNSQLVSYAILEGCVDIVKFLIESDELEKISVTSTTPLTSTRQYELMVTQIPGHNNRFLECNHRFVLESILGGHVVVLGVDNGFGIRKITKKERSIASVLGLAVTDDIVDDAAMEMEDSEEETIENSASTSEFINRYGFDHVLKCKRLLEPTIFHKILGLFIGHPKFKCGPTQLEMTLRLNDFETFEFLLKQVELTESEINDLVLKQAFTSTKPKAHTVDLYTKLKYLDREGCQREQKVKSLCLMTLSNVQTFSTEITIPFPVKEINMVSFVNGLHSDFRSFNIDLNSSYTGLQDLKDISNLLYFFGIVLGDQTPYNM